MSETETVIQHKFFAGVSTDAGTIEGYASVFGNVDRVGDRVMPGAFGTAPFTIPLFANHDTPIGRADCTPDTYGLHVVGTLADTATAQEWRTLVKVGAVPSMSFGYRTLDSQPNQHGGADLYSLDTMETSVVPIPANPAACILAAKSFGGEVPTIDMDVKVGARNSAKDAEHIQAAHDALVAAGADCEGAKATAARLRSVFEQARAEGAAMRANVAAPERAKMAAALAECAGEAMAAGDLAASSELLKAAVDVASEAA